MNWSKHWGGAVDTEAWVLVVGTWALVVGTGRSWDCRGAGGSPGNRRFATSSAPRPPGEAGAGGRSVAGEVAAGGAFVSRAVSDMVRRTGEGALEMTGAG